MSEPRTSWLVVGADVGGTFTDLIGVDASGSMHIAKVPSTPEDPGKAVVAGLEELCGGLGYELSDVALLLHGTTVATNAVLQRRGAKTALLTTKGFRDVLEIARQARPSLFDFDARRASPLVPRSLRAEVNERVDAAGAVVTPIELHDVVRAVDAWRSEGVESVAVCFLHSYANQEHEQQARKAICERWPSVHVTLSSSVLREYREYERASTSTINAFVAPVMSRYLTAMESNLRAHGSACALQIMQSSGGLMSVQQAVRLPAATALSGIAAGALGGVRLAHRAGRDVVLTLDMGGTSCDLALGEEGRVRTNRSSEIDGLPLRLPALDVHTIGAGGGSIAYLDPGGALRVGPRSAGALPGPACYERGGIEPTVTDANLVLGRLPEVGLLGGRIPLNRDRAADAVGRVASVLQLTIEAAAEGIVRVVNAGMARQMRVLTIERGIDPRSCSLVAFGGGGPAHAVELARELDIPEVIIPPAPGVTSAFGLLLADLRHDGVQTVLLEIRRDGEGSGVAEQLEVVFTRLEAEVLAQLPIKDEAAMPVVWREVEARYFRQGHELRVTAPSSPLDADAVARLSREFDRAHADRFGYAMEDEPILIVNALVTSVIPPPALNLRPSPASDSHTHPGHRSVLFDGTLHTTPVVSRQHFTGGVSLPGPVIVEQLDCTTVVPPGSRVSDDEHGNLVITVGAG